MLRGTLPRGQINRAYELCVVAKMLEHVGMLSEHGAVHDRCTRTLGHCTRRSHPHRAVDDRQSGVEKLDIAGGLSDKVLDLERIADMEDVNTFGQARGSRDVHAQ